MSRYIDADKMDELKRNTNMGFLDTSDLEECLSCFPTEDVEKIKHGKWCVCTDDCGIYGICSNCYRDVDFSHYGEAYPICPYCGAKMNEEKKDEESV